MQTASEDRSGVATAIHPGRPIKHATPPEKIPLGRNGVGIVVCEPVATSGDSENAAFGAGCARWLQFTVGGQGELQSTPLWTSIDRAQHELGRKDLRLNAKDAYRLAGIIGATHIAVGEISGTATNGVVRFQVYKAVEKMSPGEPLQASGTRDQIVAALPILASKLAASLGLKSPHLPRRVEGNSADLSRIGGLPWLPDPNTTADQRQSLVTMAQQMPLAGMLAVRSSPTRAVAALAPMVDHLLKQCPDNALAFAETGWEVGDILPRYTSLIAANRKRFPGNYLFALTDVWLQRIGGDAEAERTAAEQVVQNAPDNPEAWLTLGQTANNEADAIRRGRYARSISSGEWATLGNLYKQWLQAELHATKLDTKFAKAWLRVAQSATFAGQPQQASDAFWKSLELDKDNPEIYYWGLQMFQPKWSRDTQSLLKVANLTAEYYNYGDEAFSVVEALRQSGFKDEADRMLTSIMAHNRDVLTTDPGNVRARCTLIWALKEANQLPEGARVFREGGPQSANDARTRYATGMLYVKWGRFSNAAEQLREASRLAPDDLNTRIDLASALNELKQYAAAQAELQRVLRERPSSWKAWYSIGAAYYNDGKNDQAAHAYREVIRLSPSNYEAMEGLAQALSREKKYAEAAYYAENALQYNPENVEMHVFLSYVYAMDNDPKSSEREARTVLQFQPENLIAHENLGDALVKLGKREEARAEWQYVLKRNPPANISTEAQRNLAKYP